VAGEARGGYPLISGLRSSSTVVLPDQVSAEEQNIPQRGAQVHHLRYQSVIYARVSNDEKVGHKFQSILRNRLKKKRQQ
jgi:hypothetical protein